MPIIQGDLPPPPPLGTRPDNLPLLMHPAHAKSHPYATTSSSPEYGFPRKAQRGPNTRSLLSLLGLSLGAALLLFGSIINVGSWRGLAILKEHHDTTTSGGSGNSTNGEFSWDSIKPSRKLRWHPCYDDDAYECARLDVPLDWQDPTDGERVVLAISKLKATVDNASDNNDSDYRGPVFFNPGGPGGSGVWALRDRGAKLQTIVGRNHDVISWDPRGVGASVPRADCWWGGSGGSSDDYYYPPESRRLWDLQDVGVVDAHPGVLYDAYARAAAFSHMCEQRASAATPGLLRHMSTASHARDLLEILGQTGQERLRYWGFSYGTVLGGVFASMYPDKVERLVSDGNVDYREWHLGTHINFLRDTDRVMQAFYELCHAAGPDACAFHADSPGAIRQRHAALLDRIRKHPVIIPADGESESGPSMPRLVTWSDVKRMTSSTLYQPISFFRGFARILRALEQGDGGPYYERVRAAGAEAPVCAAEAIPPSMPTFSEGSEDAFPAIMCADRWGSSEETVEEFEEYIGRLMEISTAVGDVLALFRLACIGRAVEPKWRFAGPFEGNTSHPILYVANMADNITPFVSATNNSQGFPGSVILVQNSYGHTSLSAASACTAGYINAYFQNGTLPEPGTTCEPDYSPFQDVIPDENQLEDELAAASLGLSKAYGEFRKRSIAFG